MGLLLALVLARNGVHSTVLEKSEQPTSHPKMDLTNGRSMELFRSIGIADRIRAEGVPPDHSLDVVWATAVGGRELYRQHYASPAEQRAATIEANDGTGTTEPRVRVSQIKVEPLLRALVSAEPLCDLRVGVEVVGVEQDSGGVAVRAIDRPSGRELTLRAEYLAGCDGGSSTVRRSIGVPLQGDFGVYRVATHHFTSPERAHLAKFGRVYHLQGPHGTLIAQDGRNTWTFHGGVPASAGSEPDMAHLLDRRIGATTRRDLLVESVWTPHLAVAETYRAGRVFLAGDAAHVFIPTGGYGMNTGVGDAFDLGWKVAAVLNGWGGEGLLDSYHTERRAVALRNMAAAGHHSDVRARVARAYWRAAADGELDADGAGERRRALARGIAELYDGEYEWWGIEYGYRYRSSVIADAGEEDTPPVRAYSPTAAPGFRLPALFLADGTALHDLIGRGLTLLSTPDADLAGLAGAAESASVPLDVHRVIDEHCREVLGERLLLVRPDHHVAWSGSAVPADPTALLRGVLGRTGS